MPLTALRKAGFSHLEALTKVAAPPYLSAIAQQQKYMQNIFGSSLERIARDYMKLTEMTKVVDFPALRFTSLLQEQQTFLSYLKPAESATVKISRQIQEQQEAFTSYMKMAVETPFVKLSRQLQEQGPLFSFVKMAAESPAFSFLKHVQEVQASAITFQKYASATYDLPKLFGPSFVASSFVLQAHSTTLIGAVEDELFRGIGDTEPVDDEAAAEMLKRLRNVVRFITEYLLKFAKNHKPSVSDLFNVTLAVIIWIDGNVSTEATRSFVKEELGKSQRIMIAELHNYQNQENHVVIHETSIRVNPSHKSAKVTTLYRNQRVEVLSQKREWWYVQYFDHIDGIPKTGWVAKKYINRCKMPKPAASTPVR